MLSHRQNLETWVRWAACRVPSLRRSSQSPPTPEHPNGWTVDPPCRRRHRHTLDGLALKTVGSGCLPMPLLAASLPDRDSEPGAGVRHGAC